MPQTPDDYFWFEMWIKALSRDETKITGHEAGTVVAYQDSDLVMLDADGNAVAIVVP